MHVFRERLSVCMCASSPLEFDSGMAGLIVLVLNYCLSIIHEIQHIHKYFQIYSIWQ